MVTVLTYNIWFDQYLQSERLELLFRDIDIKQPDFICLQEVLRKLWPKIKERLIKSWPYWIEQFDQTTSSYGCVIFSRYPFTRTFVHPFTNSRMDRVLIGGNTVLNRSNISIFTTHFESDFGGTKVNQYLEAESRLSQYLLDNDAVVFCADTNIFNENDEASYFPTWKDLNKVSVLGDRATFDFQTNPYVNGNFQSRLDRIVYKGILIGKDYYLLDHHITDHPSDHY